MARYKAREAGSVDAERYEHGKTIAGLHYGTAYQRRDGDRLTKIESDPYVRTARGNERVHPGDWVVTHPDGAVEVLSPEAFERRYGPA